MSLWYVDAMWRDRLCQRKSISVRLPPYAAMHCTDLHIKKGDPLSNDHRDKMCLYSTSSAPMKIVPTILSNSDYEQRIYEIDGFSSKRLSELSLKLLLVSTKSARWRCADLILKDVMGLSVLQVWVCVCVFIHLSECLCCEQPFD